VMSSAAMRPAMRSLKLKLRLITCQPLCTSPQPPDPTEPLTRSENRSFDPPLDDYLVNSVAGSETLPECLAGTDVACDSCIPGSSSPTTDKEDEFGSISGELCGETLV
jgi:hypothetical protein